MPEPVLLDRLSGLKTSTLNAYLSIFIKILINIYSFRVSEHPLNAEKCSE